MRLYVSCVSCISCVISSELICNFKRDTHLSCVSCMICVIRISCISFATSKARGLERPRIICIICIICVICVICISPISSIVWRDLVFQLV